MRTACVGARLVWVASLEDGIRLRLVRAVDVALVEDGKRVVRHVHLVVHELCFALVRCGCLRAKLVAGERNYGEPARIVPSVERREGCIIDIVRASGRGGGCKLRWRGW